MSIEDNKDLIRRFWNELSKGNLEVIDELCAENFTRYSADGQEMENMASDMAQTTSAVL